MSRDAARTRVARLLEAARELLDPASEIGVHARRELTQSSGLSPEGVNLALELCLEANPTEQEIELLLDSVGPSPRAHVLLSANVFVAAHRAIALALSASDSVCVRSSRREPNMARLLLERAPGLFQLTDTLSPTAGDQLFAYGSEATLTELAKRLPTGVTLHAHGPGFGLAVVQEHAARDPSWSELARWLAQDLVLFDQRGCLSVRSLLFQGSRAGALDLAEALASELRAWQERAPRGRVSSEEAAEIARFRDTFAYAGSALPAGAGWVCVAPDAAEAMLAPVGRNLLLIPVMDASSRAARMASDVTTYAARVEPALAARLRAALPHARPAEFGRVQRPALDGPVDRRQLTPIRAEAGVAPRRPHEPPR
jgi:hypothetical protein